jgi:hypothetical protein
MGSLDGRAPRFLRGLAAAAERLRAQFPGAAASRDKKVAR